MEHPTGVRMHSIFFASLDTLWEMKAHKAAADLEGGPVCGLDLGCAFRAGCRRPDLS